jgi:hypothetical protein
MTDRPCTKCQNEPASPGQRWGKKCRAEYMRDWRKAADTRLLRKMLAKMEFKAEESF